MSAELARRTTETHQIIGMMLRGSTLVQIQRELKIPMKDVKDSIESWKEWARNDLDIRGRARETLLSVDESYQLLISEAYEVLNDSKLDGDKKITLAAIKQVADMEAQRAKMYAAAGMGVDEELSRKVVEAETNQKILEDILREVVNDCHHCRYEVQKRLANLTKNEQKPIIVEYVETPENADV